MIRSEYEANAALCHSAAQRADHLKALVRTQRRREQQARAYAWRGIGHALVNAFGAVALGGLMATPAVLAVLWKLPIV